MDELFQQIHDYMVLTSLAAYMVFIDTVAILIVVCVVIVKLNHIERQLKLTAWKGNAQRDQHHWTEAMEETFRGLNPGQTVEVANASTPDSSYPYPPKDEPDRFGWERPDQG